MRIRQPRAGDSNSILVRACVVGAEPFQPELPGPLRRLQVEQGREQLDLPAIVVVGLTRKPQKNIPGDDHAIVITPLQAHQILHGGHALVHRAQLGLTQALQPGLHALHPAGGKQADLVFLQITLGFDEHIEIAAFLSKGAEQVLDILHVDNVVHQTEPRRIVTTRQIGHLASDLVRRLGSELHTLRIQATEGAMVFLAPPTTARSFIQQNAIQAT